MRAWFTEVTLYDLRFAGAVLLELVRDYRNIYR